MELGQYGCLKVCGGCCGLIVYFIDYILISIVANLTVEYLRHAIQGLLVQLWVTAPSLFQSGIQSSFISFSTWYEWKRTYKNFDFAVTNTMS